MIILLSLLTNVALATSNFSSHMRALEALGHSPLAWKQIPSFRSVEWVRTDAPDSPPDRLQVYRVRAAGGRAFEVRVRWVDQPDGSAPSPRVYDVTEVRPVGERLWRACRRWLTRP